MNLKIKRDETAGDFGFVESYLYHSFGENRTFKLVTSITDRGAFAMPYLHIGQEFLELYQYSGQLICGYDLDPSESEIQEGLGRYVKAKKPVHSLLESGSVPVSMVLKSSPKRGIETSVRMLKPSSFIESDSKTVRFMEVGAGEAIASAARPLLEELLNTDGSRFEYLALRKLLV